MKYCILALFLLTVKSSLVWAGDLDDKTRYLDENIEEETQLKEPQVNIKFIILDAVTSAKKGEDDTSPGRIKRTVNISEKGESNTNSVVCRAGADCSGPIYNIINP